ncbi:hypothetical protein LC612_36840 [Nostoc sp. CHAB 5834]|nr:hypothetical protein [Nostoc sp. CHAB 5834]
MHVVVKPFEINKLYSIQRTPVRCVAIRTLGRGPCLGTQVVDLASETGDEFRLTRYPDGTVLRVVKVKKQELELS